MSEQSSARTESRDLASESEAQYGTDKKSSYLTCILIIITNIKTSCQSVVLQKPITVRAITMRKITIHEKNLHLASWLGDFIGLGYTQSELRRKIQFFFVLLGTVSVTIPEVLALIIINFLFPFFILINDSTQKSILP